MKRHQLVTILFGDTTAPTFAIECLSAASNVLSMQITASEQVTGFVVGDITISAGGSLASFATSDNIVFTVDWTLADGANTMDIAAGVCQDLARNNNVAATQYNAGWLTLQPDATADIDSVIKAGDGANYSGSGNCWLGYLSGSVRRWLIKFDITSIPTFATISKAVFTPYLIGESSSNARRMSLYRLLRDWVLLQVSATVYATGLAWQTAFCEGANDREQTEFVGLNLSATEAAGAKTITLPFTTKDDFGAYGWVAVLSDETVDGYNFGNTNNATASYRPKLEVVYYVNP